MNDHAKALLAFLQGEYGGQVFRLPSLRKIRQTLHVRHANARQAREEFLASGAVVCVGRNRFRLNGSGPHEQRAGTTMEEEKPKASEGGSQAVPGLTRQGLNAAGDVLADLARILPAVPGKGKGGFRGEGEGLRPSSLPRKEECGGLPSRSAEDSAAALKERIRQERERVSVRFPDPEPADVATVWENALPEHHARTRGDRRIYGGEMPEDWTPREEQVQWLVRLRCKEEGTHNAGGKAIFLARLFRGEEKFKVWKALQIAERDMIAANSPDEPNENGQLPLHDFGNGLAQNLETALDEACNRFKSLLEWLSNRHPDLFDKLDKFNQDGGSAQKIVEAARQDARALIRGRLPEDSALFLQEARGALVGRVRGLSETDPVRPQDRAEFDFRVWALEQQQKGKKHG